MLIDAFGHGYVMGGGGVCGRTLSARDKQISQVAFWMAGKDRKNFPLSLTVL